MDIFSTYPGHCVFEGIELNLFTKKSQKASGRSQSSMKRKRHQNYNTSSVSLLSPSYQIITLTSSLIFLFQYLVLNFHFVDAGAGCSMHNYCSGHGICRNSYSQCDCYDGWGSVTDIAVYKAPDCSQRVCPPGRAWGDVPTAVDKAHAMAECSNRGVCDRTTGECTCFSGFTGDACQRMTCMNDCSGHGQCLSMKQLATMPNALPLSNETTYSGYQEGATWDEDMIFGCLCDSAWSVGLGSGETQVPEWFGPDCSFRHCPSGQNPDTASVRNETDCQGVTAEGGQGVGKAGNLCHVDCSNRGICNYGTGKCSCFAGYYGEACDQKHALAKGG